MTIRPLRLGVALVIAVLAAGSAVAGDTGRADLTGSRQSPSAPNIAGTAAIDAGVTVYDARFRRVAASDRNDARVQAIAAQLQGLPPLEQLALVKRLVAAQVRYKTDLDNVGVSDFWAGAGETLARAAGDDEDVAIVEMQALKAAGFPAKDLYISVGRHKLRGAHHVLVARTPAGFFLLDQAENTVVSAQGRGRFVPMLTIGMGRSWIHGYRRGPSRLAAR